MGYLQSLKAVKPSEVGGISLEASNLREAKELSELKSGLQEIGKTLDLDFTAGGNAAGAIIAKRQEIESLQAAVMASNLPDGKKERLANTLGGLRGQLRRAGGRLALQGRL